MDEIWNMQIKFGDGRNLEGQKFGDERREEFGGRGIWTLCDAVVGDSSVLYIAETRLSLGLFLLSNQSSRHSWHSTKIGFSDPRKSGHWQMFPNPGLCHLDLDMDKIWADKNWTKIGQKFGYG